MTLAKMEILVETDLGKFGKTITALFNPNQITISKNVQWRLKPKPESDTGKTQFTSGEPATLNLELFFDTYESGTDVRNHTKEIFSLTTVQEHGELHRPPLCKIAWGTFDLSDTFDCQWVLTSLNQRFSLFLSDGTPVRATLGCSFRQWRGDEIEAKLLDKKSSDVAKTRILKSGETLTGIAAEEYNDPAMWRPIAQANQIDNPLVLPVGKVLLIPTLTS